MKIYFMHEQATVISPLLMNKAFQAVQELDVPDECLDFHQELLEGFTRMTVDQVNQIVRDIIDENEDFGSAILEIMKMLESSREITHASAQDQYLTEYEGDFGQY